MYMSVIYVPICTYVYIVVPYYIKRYYCQPGVFLCAPMQIGQAHVEPALAVSIVT